MLFELTVIEKVEPTNDPLFRGPKSFSPVVALFRVDTDCASHALYILVNSKEYRKIAHAECSEIRVVKEIPRYELKDEENDND